MMVKDEEIQSAKAGEEGAGETSGGTNQNTEAGDWWISINQGDHNADRLPKAKIPMVPSVLREVDSDSYDPQIISIGPYHHGNYHLKEGENIKTKMVRQLIESFKNEKTSSNIFQRVLDISKEAKAYYVQCDDMPTLNDEEFTKIMCQDGCFIIQYMVSMINGSSKELNMSNQDIAKVARDLLLVENQLPFIVLKAIADVLPGIFFDVLPELFLDVLPKLILEYFHHVNSFESIITYLVWKMYRNRLHPFMDPLPKENPLHLLDIFRWMYVGPEVEKQNDKEGKLKVVTFRSVKELQLIGFSFKKNESTFFTDIHVHSGLFFPHLSLPRIVIDKLAKAIFLNMIAYEIGKEGDREDYRVNDFICFMDSLIDHTDDVKLLRSSGILYNALGSDKEVADLFNHIAKNLVPSPNAYRKVKQHIQARYQNKCCVGFAEMWYTHFRTIWTVLALIVTVYIIFLTSVQTYFTAFPKK